MASDVYFTVFTPIYNRRHCLHRVWDSLCAQTDQDFEWVVIDDGSTDGVETLLAEYQAQAKFPMTVLSQVNQGKHVAWNRAVSIARGQFFVPADSDDEFVPETLQRFKEIWRAIPLKHQSRFSGVNVLCRDQNGKLIGTQFPADLFVSDNLELSYRYKVTGEKWGCIRTDLLKMRPFPGNVGSGYFPESWIWNWLALSYRGLCANEVLRIYHVNAGVSIMTRSVTLEYKKRSAVPGFYNFAWLLNYASGSIVAYSGYVVLVRRFIGYWVTGYLAGYTVGRILNDLHRPWLKNIALLTLIPGWIAYKRLTVTSYKTESSKAL
jgi:glycosyltransferase involved in cell wall biosynthesis